MRRRSPVAITLALGFALIAALLLGVLAQAPAAVIATNSVAVAESLGAFPGHATVCQARERIPRSTTALRISLIAHNGPAMSLTVYHRGRAVAHAHHDAGWVSDSLTFSLQPPMVAPIEAKLCLERDPVAIGVDMLGDITSRSLAATVDQTPSPGRMRVEYLSPGHRSWLSLATHVARRLGLGHEPSGTWIVAPLAALMALTALLASWLLIREQT